MSPYKLFIVAAILAIFGLGGYLYFSTPQPEPNYAAYIEPDPVTITAEDCLPEEEYDPVEEVCFVEYICESDEECAKVEEELISLGYIIDPYLEGELTISSDNTRSGEEVPAEELLVLYVVEENALSASSTFPVSEEVQGLQDDSSSHAALWDFVKAIIPLSYLKTIAYFEIFTDGVDGTLAAVARDIEDSKLWTLSLDPVDSFEKGSLNGVVLPFSLIHEFGHIVTLHENQIVLNASLLNASEETAEQKNAEARSKCEPLYFVYGEGCARLDSYVNTFYQRFWKELAPRIAEIEAIEDDEEYFVALETFYLENKNAFVTEYAATNVEEDIAESFATFILAEQPTGKGLRDQKVLFFYNYPELVSLRDTLRARLARSL